MSLPGSASVTSGYHEKKSCSGSRHTFVCEQNYMMSGVNINAICKAVFKYSKAKKKTNSAFLKRGSKEVYKFTYVNGKSNDEDHDAGCNNRLLTLFLLSLEKVNVGWYIILQLLLKSRDTTAGVQKLKSNRPFDTTDMTLSWRICRSIWLGAMAAFSEPLHPL